MLLHIIVSWLVSALALWIVAQIIPGIVVRDFGAALLATVVIAIVNATIGLVLKFLFFPLTLITLGLFLLVLNAFLLKLASVFTPGFSVRGFLSALLGSLVLTILTAVLRHLIFFHGTSLTSL
jgi:putative membrane protein